MKAKIIQFILCVMLFALIAFIAYQVIHGDSQKKTKKDHKKTEEVESKYIKGLTSSEDADDESQDMSTYQWDVNPMTKTEFVKQLLTYNKVLAYKEGGRRYDLQMPTYDHLLEGTSFQEYEGLDSLGFVDWAYRLVTGTSLNNIEDPVQLYEASKKVTVDELEVGNIGMFSIKDNEENHYGIYVGTYHDIPVFAHCSSNPVGNMERGCLQFSYLDSKSSDLLDKVPSVTFHYFFRPVATWKEGEESVKLDMINGTLGVVE